MTVYKSRIALNARACFILRVSEGGRIGFVKKGQVLYIFRCDKPCGGYNLVFRKGRRGAVVNSTQLAGEIAYAVGGHGICRLRNDISFFENGVRHFGVVHHLD